MKNLTYMDDNLETKTVTINEAIAYYKRGINEDIFREPVTSYAKMAVAALEKIKTEQNLE